MKNNPVSQTLQTCHLVIMGVSGCGKSNLGTRLAQSLQRKFIEGDDYHSPHNVKKMKTGQPLTDQDRIPWLKQLSQIRRDSDDPTILSCSALKYAYRKMLRSCTNPCFLSISNLIGNLHVKD